MMCQSLIQGSPRAPRTVALAAVGDHPTQTYPEGVQEPIYIHKK